MGRATGSGAMGRAGAGAAAAGAGSSISMYSGSGVAMSCGLGPCVAESGNCAPAAKPMSARAMNTKNFCAGNKNKNRIMKYTFRFQ